MAHAWKACWVKALGGSNPPSSANFRSVARCGYASDSLDFFPKLLTVFFLADGPPRGRISLPGESFKLTKITLGSSATTNHSFQLNLWGILFHIVAQEDFKQPRIDHRGIK